MGQLRRAQNDGHYYTIAFKGQPVTYQISADGVNYLRGKSIKVNSGNVRPYLEYLLKRRWAWDNKQGSADTVEMTDYAWRLADTEPADRPPLIGIPRLCLLNNHLGELRLHVMVPSIPRDRLKQLNGSDLDLLESPECRYSVGKQTTYPVSNLLHDPVPIEVKPSFATPIRIQNWRAWPPALHWPELTVPLDGLLDYELFALPEKGGKRLLRPRVAPGESLLMLERQQPVGSQLWSRDLMALGCNMQRLTQIAEWTVYRITLPDTRGIKYDAALEIIDGRPVQSIWQLSLLGSSFSGFNVEGIPVQSLPGKLFVSCSVVVRGAKSGTTVTTRLRLFKDGALERVWKIDLRAERDSIFDLPVFEQGFYTVVVGSKELGWSRTSFYARAKLPMKRTDDRFCSVVVSTFTRNHLLNITDNAFLDIKISQSEISTIKLMIRRWRRKLQLSLWSPLVVHVEEVPTGLQPSERFMSALRAHLFAGKPVRVQVEDKAIGHISVTITPILMDQDLSESSRMTLESST
jgi:hypothetical protein